MYAKKRQSGRTDRENVCAEVCHKAAARETAPCRDCCLNIKDYEENIDEALAMLEKAGADRLIEEFKTQLAESKK